MKIGYGVVVACGIAALLSGCVSLRPATVEPTPTPTETREPRPTIPTGYTYEDGGLAYMFLEDFECTGDTQCVVVEVYAYQDCPSGLFVNANTLEQVNGVVLGSTSGTLASLEEGQRGRLELAVLEPDAGWVEVTSLGCN